MESSIIPTSPGTGTPLAANNPRTPIGNQHRKSEAAIVRSLRATVMSLLFLLLSLLLEAANVFVLMDQ